VSYIHFSRTALTTARDSPQDGMDCGGAKPTGLWFTVGMEGAERWKAIAYGKNLLHATELSLDERNILRIRTVEQIVDLERACGMGLSPGGRGRLNWSAIALRFDGIIVSPYQADERVLKKTCWYHEWDCASGCVWKSKAVLALRPFVMGP
jgi:hypothetical protein